MGEPITTTLILSLLAAVVLGMGALAFTCYSLTRRFIKLNDQILNAVDRDMRRDWLAYQLDEAAIKRDIKEARKPAVLPEHEITQQPLPGLDLDGMQDARAMGAGA